MKNTEQNNVLLPEIIDKVTTWHYDRNLIDGATDESQFVKLTEELGELAGNIARKRPLIDDIGDMMVVLINISERNGLSIEHCLAHAYEDIKDRKGRMINGMFVKEQDLPQ